MTGSSGADSFKIPEYQRPYDWTQQNIDRLLSNCLDGLKRAVLGSISHPFTFVGAIILAPDDSTQGSFDEKSLLIVDGQQRLTTLLLLSCVLFEAIRTHKHDIATTHDAKVQHWLTKEIEEQLNRLYKCTTGQLHGISPTPPFPRMVRANDTLSPQDSNSIYQSLIASLLNQFGDYCQTDDNEFSPEHIETENHLLKMYQHLRTQIDRLVYKGNSESEDQDDDFDPPVLVGDDFIKTGCEHLFAKLVDVGDQSQVDEIISIVSSTPGSDGLVRLLLFASYMIQSVVLTVVVAPNEDIGFDIFDALNTTGEPLTALETLKPHIVRFDAGVGDEDPQMVSETWWELIEEHVTKAYDSPIQRQNETKELVTGFALYYAGDKLGTALNVQRNALRDYFIHAKETDHNVAREFVTSLGRLARYRRQYWDKKGINRLFGHIMEPVPNDLIKLCLRFLADTNTSTTIPILARYRLEYEAEDVAHNFFQAVKAVTAFLALRRAMTGGTAGIDSDFRKIMSARIGDHGDPLCLGLDMNNRILDIDELKSRLCKLLATSRFRVTDKNTWLAQAKEVAHGSRTSKPVCRFLLFAAAHNARVDTDHPGLLKAEGVRPSDELRFLSYSLWVGPRYATVEHVAPNAQAISGWNTQIYERPSTRQTIGNLVLLPERENQSIGNAPWEKKKLFYRALAAKSDEEMEEAIGFARQQGITFGNQTLNLIENQDRLHMLDPIAEVEDWTAGLIEARTENLLSLAWDNIAPWLFD